MDLIFPRPGNFENAHLWQIEKGITALITAIRNVTFESTRKQKADDFLISLENFRCVVLQELESRASGRLTERLQRPRASPRSAGAVKRVAACSIVMEEILLVLFPELPNPRINAARQVSKFIMEQFEDFEIDKPQPGKGKNKFETQALRSAKKEMRKNIKGNKGRIAGRLRRFLDEIKSAQSVRTRF